MNDSEYYRLNKNLQYQPTHTSKNISCSHGGKNILITVKKKRNKIRTKHNDKLQDYTQPTVLFHLSNFGSSKSRRLNITKHASMPEINKNNVNNKSTKLKPKSLTAIAQKKCRPYSKKYTLKEHSLRYNLNPFTKINQPTFKVYRCQLTPNVAENCNNCCCSCNSDAMFEVMKDLYDCYKKRNCDNCNCILCCHLPMEKPLDKAGKPCPEINLETALKEVAMRGFALPEGKTASEKKLISNIRKRLGLPPEPTSQRMRDTYTNAANVGVMVPLEGKSTKQKEKILRDLHRFGIPLPVGRTPSEQALIDKIEGKAPGHSEKLRSSLLTTLEGKSHDKIEKMLREQAMQGIPLPKGDTESIAKLIDKVRTDLGLPPSPRTSNLRDKYANAAEDGILLPLEGKSDKEKERILRGLHERGIPLPEGRTSSEKSLVDKILQEKRSPSPKMDKPKTEQEKKLRELAMKGIPLPEGKTESDKKLLKKVRTDLGLPPEPKTQSMKNRYDKAANMGLMYPLEGKSIKEKEKILRGLAELAIPLPKGRTPSEVALIAKVKGEPRDSSMLVHLKVKDIDSSKVLLSLEGKTPEEIEKILRKLAMRGIPLPEGQTASQKKLINKIRIDLGLPPEPKTSAMKEKHQTAAEERLLLPLEGKSNEEKEIIIQGLLNMGIPLPKGRTPSEKALIARVRERHNLDKKTSSDIKESEGPVNECICSKLAPPLLISLDLKRRAQAAEQLLDGKTADEKEKILLSLAKEGIPLPKGKTASEKKLIRKIRIDLGLPPEPKTASMRDKHEKAAEKNLLQPLKGKSPEEKERILRGLLDLRIQLPKPRTESENSMIIRLQLEHKTPSGKLKRAKAAGLLTPLEGKTPSQQEDILRGLAIAGIPLPKGKTGSQNKLIIKVRNDLGLPPEPKNSSMRNKYAKAAEAGLLVPLEGKTHKEKEKILRGLNNLGISLPKARSSSENLLIIKIQGKRPTLTASEKMRGAKAAGLLTPLKGKTPAQKERILRGLAEHGIPLPEGQTMSEKSMIIKVRYDLGLSPEPKTPSMREKYARAADAGILEPLEGKTPKEKEKNLRRLVEVGLPLPKARTASEKALIDKIKGEPRGRSRLSQSEKMRKAQSAGLLTPLKGKTPAEIEIILRGLADLGIPLPDGKTASEQNIINKVRFDLGLPPEPKTSAMREKHKKAAEIGLLIPLEGKLPKEKKKVLQGLADMGIPLPAGRTDSEKSLIAKISERKKLDRKPSQAPRTTITTEKLRQAKAAGLLTPLEKKSPEEKEKILRNLVKLGLPLPEGRTRSDRALINQIKREYNLHGEPSKEKIRRAIADGLLTPLDGKTPELKEKILRGRAAAGLPLPVGKTPSEKDLISRVKASTGYVTPSPSKMLQKAEAAGLLPLKAGKTPTEKEKILRQLAAAGIPLPEGKTPSEKEIINKIKALQKTRSDKIKAAKAAGLLTPLRGKTPEQKDKILRGLVKNGLPLPEGKTPSEKSLIDKIRAETGLPPTPKTPSMRERYRRAQDAGIITPLEGKTMSEKENILRRLHEEGLPLPAGRTPSEKSLIKKIKAGLPGPQTPLEDMESAKKEKILRSLIKSGRSLPDAKTPSTINLINKVRKDLGLPPEPTTASMKDKMRKAYSSGLITPLEGKTSAQKEKILRGLADAGIPLPEGRTPSEKAIKRKIQDESRKKLHRATTKRITKDKGVSQESGESWPNKRKKAEELGLTTPLSGKSPKEKERILRGLAKLGLPLPEGTTKSDKQLIKHVRKDMGLPPDPETPSMKKRHLKAANEGVLYPLEGLTQAEKEQLLRSQAKIGLTLPAGRTPSEKSLINKIKEELALSKIPPEKLQKAKDVGLLTPLEGKSQAEKEKILRGRAKAGLPLPEVRTMSEKYLIKKIKSEFRKPSLSKEALRRAKERGLFTPLEGKTSAEKEKILHGLAEAGLPFPEAKTSKDRALMKKLKETHKVTKEKESETRVLGSKITKCERACGCDKKKIRFKHSYVKIKVTSPDISSLCPCPDECIPGVKGGVFVDNQGVNVIIESAVGIPQYKVSNNGMSENLEHDHRQINNLKPLPTAYDIQHKNRNLIRSIYDDNTLNYMNSDSQDSLLDTPFTHIPLAHKRYYETRTLYRQYAPKLVIYNSYNKICSIGKFENHSRESHPYYEASDFITYVSNHLTATASSSRDSFDSIKIIHSETSLSFSSTYEEASSSSVISFAASVSTSNSNAYQLSLSNVAYNSSAVVKSVCLTNGVECCAIDTNRSSKVDIEYQASAVKNTSIKRKQMPDDVFEVFPMSSTNPSSVNETKNNSTYKDNVGEPVIIITNLNSNLDLTSVVDELITKKEFCEASSLFVVVPTSDEEENEIRVLGLGSTQCLLSENCNNCQNAQDTQPRTTCRRTSSKTQDLRTTEKPKLFLKNLPTTVLSSMSNRRTMYHYVENSRNWMPRNQICQIITPNVMFQEFPGVSTDTTQDRPCCCGKPGPCANVMSEVIPPLYIQRGLESKTFSVHRITEIPQASCVSMIRSPALSVNRMAECHRHPDVRIQSSKQILQYPFDTPMPRHLKYFKKLLQRTLSSHTMNKILRELDSGQLDRSSLDESNDSPSEISPEESLLSNSSVTRLNVGDLSTEKKDMTQQVSVLLTSTISRCEIAPCDGRNSCHTPDQILQFPFGTPLSEPLEKLKKLVQLNCSPEKVKNFFEKIEAGNVKDIDLEFEEAMKTDEAVKTNEAMKTNDSSTTESDLVRTTEPNCRIPSCKGHPGCHSVDEVLQFPFGTPLPPNLVKLKELLEQNCSPQKVKFLFDQIEAGNLKNIDWQASLEIATDSPVDVSPSINAVPRPTSNCRLPPCHGHPGCHPPDVILQYPFGTLLSPELTELKRLIEQNECPEKVKNLYAQITSGNLKNVHWKEDAKFPTHCPPDTQPPLISVPTSEIKSKLPPFQERQLYSSPDKRFKSPSGTLLLPELEGFKEIIKHRHSPDKVKYSIRETEAGNRKKVEVQKLVLPTDLQSDDHPLSVSTPTAKTRRFKPYEKYPEPSHSSLQLLITESDKLGNSLDDNCNSKKKGHLSDFMSDNCSNLKSMPTTSTCVLSSCYSPDEVSRYPYGTALPPHLIRLKELLEENSNPQRVKELFQKIEAGHFKSDIKTPCSDPPCQKNKSYSTGCHLPDEVMQYPFGVPLSHSLENLKKVIERNGCPKKVKKLFRQIQDGENVCNLDWVGALDNCTEYDSDNNSTCRNPNCEKKPRYSNQGNMLNVPCPEPNCQKNTGCHLPDEVLQYPFGVPLSHSLENLKKVIERNGCPKKVKKLFRQIQDGENVCNLDWAGALNNCTEYNSDDNSTCQNPNCEKKRRYSNQGNILNVPCPEPTCQKNTGCHLPDEVLQYPFGVPLSNSLQNLKKIIEHNGCPKKVKKLYKQIQDGENVCNLDWEGASNNCTELYPKNCSTSGVKPCRNPTCDKNRRSSNRNTSSKTPCRELTCPQKTCCDLLDEGTPSPSGIPLSQSLENLRKLIQRNRKPKKVKKCCKQVQDSDNVCNLDFEGVKPCQNSTCKKKHTCRGPTCPKNTCCHLPDQDECPRTVSLSKSIETLKKLLERNRHSKKKKSCKQKQNTDNTCHNPDCEGALDSPSECYPENYYSASKQNPCRNPTCKKKNRYGNHDSKPKLPCPEPTCQKQTSCHLPDELLQFPFGTPLPQSLENLKKIIERDGCPKKVKKLYKQIQNNDSYCKLDWEGAMDTCSLYDPDDFESPKVIPCRTPTCQKSPGCHLAGEIIQYPYNTPLPQQLIKLKTFLEQNSNPKEVMDLIGQIEAGNLKNLDWDQALRALTDFSPDNIPNSELISPTISTCHIPVCQGQSSCHLPDEILQYPFGTPLPEHLVKLKNLIEQNNNPNKVKELFRQLEAGNWKDLDWDGAYETHPHQDYQDLHSIDERSFETPLLPLPMLELKNLIEEICSPGTVQQLIKQIDSCNLNNMKSVGCGENSAIPVVITPDVCPPSISTATDSMSLHMPPERTPESILLKPDAFPLESILLKPGAFPPGAPPMIFPPGTPPMTFPPGASPMICPPGAPTSGVCAPGISPRLLLPHMIPIVLPPEVYAPAPKDEDCATCHKPKYRDGVKMKCACSGKKKTVKKKPCPCELHKVPISTEQSGLKIATHSKPAQCCICDDYFAGVKKSGKDVIFKLGQSAPSIIGTPGGPVSTGVQGGTGCIKCPTGLPCSSDHTTCPKLTTITISPIPMGYYGQPDAQTLMGELEIIGPQGGYVMIGPDGISTQSGVKVIKFSTGTGTDPDSDNVGAEATSKKKKNCLCFGKKKRKITCECPPETESEVEPLLLYTYEDFEEARKLSKQYKSDLTQTTSGFKFDKKKRPPVKPTPEYTVEDAIRDYAIIRPDFIRSLVPPGVRRKNKVDCACEEDVGVGSYEILKKNAKGGWEYENPEPVPPEDVPLKGLKFSIGGKGSGSKGLSGICCFEMYQDS